ncbi:uroporphyrinogen-III C-methyltransferase [Chryseolinea sp. T2]|uniref:uroporphyrinogen-III C-methyltransferase n=1 Tax=Chryseolinea sp. T2 TaxID=3129255 RepID=UPI003077943E
MSTDDEKSRVVLMGAGPGDPELLTIKADRLLREADVVLYDALVNTEILERCRPGCKLVYVGKRKGNASLSQDEINRLILWHAHHHFLVVRLKGGDPFVFGRGHEEAAYLLRFGIHAEIVPGITSALAAPALAGISVTQRGVNESFWVVTGTLSDGGLSTDITYAAQSSATIVILMGLGKLAEIAALVARYRSPLEPMAIVQHASTPGQREVYSNANNITADAETHQISAPAVIIVGNVVENTLSSIEPIVRTYQPSLLPNHL